MTSYDRDFALTWTIDNQPMYLAFDGDGRLTSTVADLDTASRYPTPTVALAALLTAALLTPVLCGSAEWTANVSATRVRWH